MVKVEDSNPKNRSGSYDRLFGDKELGYLMSKVQSASIRAGAELERIIGEKSRKITGLEGIESLDQFLQFDRIPDGSYIVTKKEIKASNIIQFGGSEPDFMIFSNKAGKQTCQIVELKDGDTFDTKKSAGERQSLHDFLSRNAPHIPYKVSVHICCFNQDSKEAIVAGFKSKITLAEAMTGREFCELLVLDYDEIVQMREEHQQENITYFLTQLIQLQDEAIQKILSSDG